MGGYNYNISWFCDCGDIEYSVFQLDYKQIIVQYWDKTIPFEMNDWITIKTLKYVSRLSKNNFFKYQLDNHKKDRCK